MKTFIFGLSQLQNLAHTHRRTHKGISIYIIVHSFFDFKTSYMTESTRKEHNIIVILSGTDLLCIYP